MSMTQNAPARQMTTCTETLCVEFGQVHEPDDYHEAYRVTVNRDFHEAVCYDIAVRKEVTPGNATNQGWFIELDTREFFADLESVGKFTADLKAAEKLLQRCEGYVSMEAVSDAFPGMNVADLFKAPHIVSNITGYMLWRLEDVAAMLKADQK
ncbi:hypothetical protein [Microbacterium imperiale]|uniref:Uncharacterized protein n=1 Tax=Microbacterium imperiale TaxID=33884 RepID=A0A9W6HFV4_9MICO|nr:hypothetical protein [Microbacterium imperiale]MBP2422076.1 hypothetical protein [Microbacterium imperiale]MDS0200235.1 hypothetical protein [Microbacterium imperiale]BFE39387.1 hypothetical protein GCM10017544_03430 [Microbacterium imperiale]GLJ79746.1 hypothetical protein GCM10017586_14280 [Microbacterium imperiale]